jgi:hypothetical protein
MSGQHHHSTIVFLPFLHLWIAVCMTCGSLSNGVESDAAAWAIADTHNAAHTCGEPAAS